MASTVWKGYLTFGLISIPLRLFAAARSERVSFNQLHKECNSRIKQQIYCPSCDRPVERSELVKGYEYAKDRYVLVEEDDLKKLAPASEQTMEILQFVKLQDVDPLYYDASYYAVPDAPGRKPYHLLVKTMEDSSFAALAKLTMHQREYTVLIRPRDNGLTLHTMYYVDDVRALAEYGQNGDVKITPQELDLARKLVESLTAPFEPDKFKDEYQVRVREMLEAKQRGEAIAEAPKPRLAPVIDLMEALQKSLATGAHKKPPSRADEAQEAVAEEPAKSRRRPKVKAAR
ncbi:MAG: Ku protein [Bryobacteraceae bacterium]|nr:Ku protein [Bryobacteraceae bacterium]